MTARSAEGTDSGAKRAIGYRRVVAGQRSARAYHLGQFRTPESTARYMAEQVLSYLAQGGRCLDPAAGDGVFLRALRDLGLPPERLDACDLDGEALAHLRGLAGRAMCRDFLLEDDGARYRAILGNPPYQSHESDYIRRHRRELVARYGEAAVANLYCLFTLAALERLEVGGVLCFLLLDSFLTNVAYRPFRRALLHRTLVREVLLAPRRLFHGQKADVRTVILTLEKTGGDCGHRALRHGIRTVDRLRSESEYRTAPREEVAQSRLLEDPDHRFVVGVPPRLHDVLLQAPVRLGEVFRGGAGISTGNDARFLRPLNQVDPGSGWVPFYKNPGRPYHCPPTLALHRDWRSGVRASHSYIARNRSFYFQEGVACSSMGIPFRACHLPPGCLFGVNTCLFHPDRRSLFAALAYLNSSLAEYWVRAVLNRTNMVTARYVKSLPWPAFTAATADRLAAVAEATVQGLSAGAPVDLPAVRREVDSLVFGALGLGGPDSQDLRDTVHGFCADIVERL